MPSFLNSAEFDNLLGIESVTIPRNRTQEPHLTLINVTKRPY